MQIDPFALLSGIEDNIAAARLENPSPLSYAPKAVALLENGIRKLRASFLKKPPSGAGEIDFFRRIKPAFTGRLLFYQNLCIIAAKAPAGGRKALRRYYGKQRRKIKCLSGNDGEFYRYYRSGASYLDDRYFIRGAHPAPASGAFPSCTDSRFSTSHDHLVARIVAGDLLAAWLRAERAALRKKTDTAPKQKWTAPKVALVELVYALHAEGVFNNGASGLREVAQFLQSAFGVDLGQFHRVFLEMRERKTGRARFLAGLQEKLLTRMDDADK